MNLLYPGRTPLKIAVDFDNVIVDTMTRFLEEWEHGEYKVSDLKYWNLAEQLDADENDIHIAFAYLNYSKAKPIPDSILGIRELLDDRHSVTVVTNNPRFNTIRAVMQRYKLDMLDVVFVQDDKAEFVADHGYDILIDDKPQTLEDTAKSEIYAIRFIRPWNFGMDGWGSQKYQESARTWSGVVSMVRMIEYLKSTPTPAGSIGGV